MPEVNWGIASQPNSFENALAKGFQIGQHIKQQRDEKEYKNALAGYDPANPETLKPVMAADPRLGLQLQGQQRQDAQAQAQQAEQQRAQYQQQMGTMRQLLTHAKTNPQQAIAAAQQMGIDTSKIPPPDSLEFQPWVDQQLFIADALAKADPGELKGIAYELEQAGYTPGTPEFEQAARSVISNKYATEYVDENGNTRRRSALDLNRQPPAAQPYDPNEWEEVDQGGQTATPSATFSGGFRPVGINQAGITSTYRTPAHNREVGGVANSYHTRRGPNGEPLAIDSVPPRGMSMAAYHAKLKRENPGLDVINEGDHIHVEPKGR